MGLPPCSLRELHDYIETMRGLLSNQEVAYQEGAEDAPDQIFFIKSTHL